VFVTPPFPGHVFPVLPLVQRLVTRGHRVSYVTSPALTDQVKAAGAQAVELDWELGGGPPKEISVDTLLAMLNAYLDVAEPAFPGLLDRFRREQADLVCFDSVIVAPLLAGALGVPTVSLIPNIASNEHFSPAEVLPGFSPSHPGIAAFGARISRLAAQYDLNIPFHHLVGGGFPSGLKLVLIPREFQIAGDTFDDTYRFIGPSADHRADPKLWQPARGDAPVLLISLGTAFTDRPEFFTACVEAFGDTRWQVVMSIGGTDPAALGTIPANFEVAPSVPQPAVLRHADAFITHAGMGGVMESLLNAVPVIALPQIHEQKVNARRVEELGLGRVLPEAPTARQLREIVDQVADDPKVRENLADMKRAIEAAGGADAGAVAIEEFLARGR
jgi:MGT family glycosyltransferase